MRIESGRGKNVSFHVTEKNRKSALSISLCTFCFCKKTIEQQTLTRCVSHEIKAVETLWTHSPFTFLRFILRPLHLYYLVNWKGTSEQTQKPSLTSRLDVECFPAKILLGSSFASPGLLMKSWISFCSLHQIWSGVRRGSTHSVVIAFLLPLPLAGFIKWLDGKEDESNISPGHTSSVLQVLSFLFILRVSQLALNSLNPVGLAVFSLQDSLMMESSSVEASAF